MVTNDQVTAEKRTSRLSEKSQDERHFSDSLEVDQIFDPSRVFDHVCRCSYWNAKDQIRKGKIFVTSSELLFKCSRMPFVKVRFDLKEIEQIRIVKKFKSSSENVLCIHLGHDVSYTFCKFEYPKTMIQQILLDLSEKSRNGSFAADADFAIQEKSDRKLNKKSPRYDDSETRKHGAFLSTIKLKDPKNSLLKLKNKIIPSMPGECKQVVNKAETVEKLSVAPLRAVFKSQKSVSENDVAPEPVIYYEAKTVDDTNSSLSSEMNSSISSSFTLETHEIAKEPHVSPLLARNQEAKDTSSDQEPDLKLEYVPPAIKVSTKPHKVDAMTPNGKYSISVEILLLV